jgi:hypothetical protein
VPAAAGRWFSPEEGKPGAAQVVMASERLARSRFGDAARAVGQNLAANDQPVTIVGVMPASFRSLFDVDLWTVIRRGEGIGGAARRFHNLVMVGQRPEQPLTRRRAGVVAGLVRPPAPSAAYRLVPSSTALMNSSSVASATARKLGSSANAMTWPRPCG